MGDPLETLMGHPEFREGRQWHRERAGAGTEILREGNRTAKLYLVISGKVRVLGTVQLASGRKIHPGVCDLCAGQMFGELSLFDDEPHSATVTAIEETELAVIEGAALLEFLERHRDIGFEFYRALMGQLVTRLRKTNERVYWLLAWGMKSRELDG